MPDQHNLLSGGARVHLVAGTRPEAVKIAPLVRALIEVGLVPTVVDTGQQPGRVDEALRPFDLSAAVNLGIKRRDGGLAELMSLTIKAADDHLRLDAPAAVVVQGDTSTALAVGLAAHLRRIPLVHVEAGLRTGDRENPFPEETNRTLLADLADLHLAPTARAAAALAAEGHVGDHVLVSGNTVVDALQTLLPAARATGRAQWPKAADEQRLVVTVHRREAWGEGVQAVTQAVKELLGQRANLQAYVVTHPNPAVAADVRAALGDTERCTLLDPLPYDDMLAVLSGADAVLTDSGGIQEEAPTIGVQAVVARTTTERPEGIDTGWARLAGLQTASMVELVGQVLDGDGVAPGHNPYGDGEAGPRSALAIRWLLDGGERPKDWQGQ
ncbi:non-hydrolyzing UDP-N-acetylglucosamine 2-epimerase [Pedococcus sp. 5OH_020]|uniref:non-hydrolyzing UDP-N-acetylglucosamine 2-epimerase n=1 Tax=Pedococcus sp. 5OH_020 TaxID=2989814 RepID=UPI0022E9CB29|nr:UDP-N-acetylglucosamine 2-epimerase (non-hydrolyzing) [Pedococcus sp. 5OH_020]